jgi:hypothetical protein
MIIVECVEIIGLRHTMKLKKVIWQACVSSNLTPLCHLTTSFSIGDIVVLLSTILQQVFAMLVVRHLTFFIIVSQSKKHLSLCLEEDAFPWPS